MIGTRPRPSSGDGVDLLLECHERIRRFLAMARRLAGATGVPPDEIAETARQVARYFTEALPLHVADEDEELPRLVAVAELATMTAQHREHAPLIDRMVDACRAAAAQPAAAQPAGAWQGELATVLDQLEPALHAHLELEEQRIFPALRALPEAARAELARAIRARRS